MNQDFGLSLTPANARRLLRFQDIFNLDLDTGLIELAEQDKITEDDFDQFVCPSNKVTRTITQFLLDCNLRGIVQENYHPQFSGIELLNVVRIKQPKYISILTKRSGIWQSNAKTLFMKNNIRFYNHFQMTAEEIDSFKEGVLIIDMDFKFDYSYMNKLRDFGSEFPQTIVFCPKTEELTPWTTLARALFPTMPHPLYARLVKNVPPAWNNIPLSLFANFFNMCLFPEYVTDESIIKLMSDDNRSFHNVTIS